MDFATFKTAPHARRFALLLLFALCALLAACGGGGGAPAVDEAAPSAPTSTITGTAATGAPLAGVTVTVKDGSGRSGTATTAANGTYTLDTSGMTPPYLVQVVTPSGTALFSVSANLDAHTVVNITPLTDLIVRSWYEVQGIAPAAAFADPASAPAPTPLQVRTIAQTVLQVLQLALDRNDAGIADALDFIAKPFAADHTGIDKVLDLTRVTLGSGAITLVITDGSTTQTTVVSYDTAAGALTAATTVSDGANSTTSSITTVVPVEDAQARAVQDLQDLLARFAGVVNTKGSSLAAADILPFTAPDLLDEARNREQFAAGVVSSFAGMTVNFQVLQVKALDLAAGMAELMLRLTVSDGSDTSTEDFPFFFKKVGADWLVHGDQRPGQISINAEGRRNQGSYTQGNGPSINFDVRMPVGMFSGASFTVGGQTQAMMKSAQTAIDEQTGAHLDHFIFNTGPLAAPLPAAGTVYTVNLARAAGGTLSYPIALNTFSTELIQITSPTGSALANANLGGNLAVAWTRPTTYAVVETQLAAVLMTQNFQCIVDTFVTASATSGTLAMPTTCSGQPVTQANINVSTTGPNGERSIVIYTFSNAP